MEWNARPPLQWDWDNLTVLNPSYSEHSDVLHPTFFQTKHGINSGPSNSAGDDRTTGGPFFKLGQTSPKISKSVSTNSSFFEKSRTTKFTLEGFEPTLEDSCNKKEFVEAEVVSTYGTPETSTCSCEPMLSLKLGKQAYFENASAVNLTKPSALMVESRATRKRCQNTPSAHCQVEGCNMDISNVKDYYRKHRVCESHSKSPKVIIGGFERRFCQQCSRFHSISEFDGKKRSCRRRLSNHNARRRKPQSKVVGLNPARLSSWDFENRQIDIFSDKLSLIYPTPNEKSAWESAFSSRHPQCGKYVSKPEPTYGSIGQLNVSEDEMCYVHAMPYHDNTSKAVPFKGAATKILDPGYVIPSNLNSAQDLQRALSLLSTDTKGPYEARLFAPDNPNRLVNPNYANQPSISQSPMNLGIQTLPFASVDSQSWGNGHHHPIELQMQIHHPNIEGGNNLFQDFQLFKTPCEIGMFSNQIS
ncbi:squamosa promoter-binding-like protein 12 isoform X2 [Cucurbita maxima]|uniref:Squamosa promoter-binding-like protein 12 isoform X2 n=1 Tax=Cucurbita maxima TaxID=3661 RepID=A0A6J1KF78_CUCMA|nr:squamosa promoter-binding-like protein 12 isoform X2 [Cucurbita maxima]